MDILLGKNALNGKDVFLKQKGKEVHMHIIGSSGAGKSKFMEHLMREDIKAGRGFCLVDPHGDLYQNILKYVVRRRMEKRVILIDPNDEEWSVGLNYLEYNKEIMSSASHASSVMSGISKVFGGENTDIAPRLQRWERNTLVPLIERQLTLIEMTGFVNPQSPELRAVVLKEVRNEAILQEWDIFDKSNVRDRTTYIEPVLNRANKFAASPVIRRIFGQEKSTIDFRQAMDEGKIILCNLACTKMSDEEQRLLGIVILDKLVQAGKSRVNIPEVKRKPYYVYLDEFGLFVSKDIARALQELRKFRVFFILAHQELEQLREDDRSVYSAVMSEPQIRVSFRISREDAEIMAKEMFTGKIKPYEKRRIEQTKFRPVETTRSVSSSSYSTFEGESYGQSESSGESETRLPPEFDFFNIPLGTDDDIIYISSSSSSTTSSSRSRSSGSSYGETTVPFYEFEEFKEVSSIEDFSVEELIEKFISWIKTQPDRHAQLKIKQNPPIPIITPWVKDLPVREKDIRELKESVYSVYALPAHEADLMIEQRRTRMIGEAESMGMIPQRKEQPALTPESMRHK